jgi:hypothetical protein
MADDRKDIPGSGDVQSDRAGEDDGPPPQATSHGEDVPPPSPQGTSQTPQGPTAAEGGGRSWWPVCLIGGVLGCGCLLIVLMALGVIGGLGLGIFSENEGPSNTSEQIEQSSGSQGDSDQVGQPQETVSGPSREAALQWAEERRPEWEATIRDSSEDWQWVRLGMGPPGSGGTTWVEIEWNKPAGQYALLDEGPIASDVTAPVDVPEIYRPGEEVAKEAALSYVEQPNWVARVDSHSEDWHRATVSVGPPYSEWVYVVTLQWEDEIDAYEQVAIDDVEYPGME